MNLTNHNMFMFVSADVCICIPSKMEMEDSKNVVLREHWNIGSLTLPFVMFPAMVYSRMPGTS